MIYGFLDQSSLSKSEIVNHDYLKSINSVTDPVS